MHFGISAPFIADAARRVHRRARDDLMIGRFSLAGKERRRHRRQPRHRPRHRAWPGGSRRRCAAHLSRTAATKPSRRGKDHRGHGPPRPGRADGCHRPRQRRRRRARTAARFGPISILVNNAGINKPTDFDQIERCRLGLRSSTPISKALSWWRRSFLPLLKEAGGGAIVHIGSVSGQYGGPRTAHYAASKAGLISLAQVIARFGAPHNIRSNVVAAGLIASEMAAGGLAAASVQKAAENILLKRMGTPQEVADAVVFLASDASSYITAQTLNVNGGLYF